MFGMRYLEEGEYAVRGGLGNQVISEFEVKDGLIHFKDNKEGITPPTIDEFLNVDNDYSNKLFKPLKIKQGEREYLVKFKEYDGWITVKLYSPKFPYMQLNKKIEHEAYYLNGKEQLIKDAIFKYEYYKQKAEEVV